LLVLNRKIGAARCQIFRYKWIKFALPQTTTIVFKGGYSKKREGKRKGRERREGGGKGRVMKEGKNDLT